MQQTDGQGRVPRPRGLIVQDNIQRLLHTTGNCGTDIKNSTKKGKASERGQTRLPEVQSLQIAKYLHIWAPAKHAKHSRRLIFSYAELDIVVIKIQSFGWRQEWSKQSSRNMEICGSAAKTQKIIFCKNCLGERAGRRQKMVAFERRSHRSGPEIYEELKI